jgi:hypothetical protein
MIRGRGQHDKLNAQVQLLDPGVIERDRELAAVLPEV